MFRMARLVLVPMLVCAACRLVSAAGEAAADLPPNLHWWVVQHTENGQKADFFVVLKGQADVSPARALSDKKDKGRFVFSALTQAAEAAQGPLRAWLDARGVRYQPFWIVNAILVQGGDRALAIEAARRPEVARVEGNPVIQNVLPRPGAIEDLGGSVPPAPPSADGRPIRSSGTSAR